MEFHNKVVIVTGAGSKIGRQLVLQLAEKRASVAAVDRNPKSLALTKEMVQNSGRRVTTHLVDITDQEKVYDLTEEIIKEHGNIDVLINNVGIIQPFITGTELKYDIIRKIMEINFFEMINMIKAFLPYLTDSREAYIANILSMGGFLPEPGQFIYGTSKAAVKLLEEIVTEGLRLELSQTKIRTSAIVPGQIETDIKNISVLKEKCIPEIRRKSGVVKRISPDHVAKIILKGIEKKKEKILIGRDALLMDIFYKIMPKRTERIISKVIAKNHGEFFNTTEDF